MPNIDNYNTDDNTGDFLEDRNASVLRVETSDKWLRLVNLQKTLLQLNATRNTELQY
jgi:hypothetical protein